MRGLAGDLAAVIRIDAVWLATAPIDMRAGTETALNFLSPSITCANADATAG